MGYTVTVIFYRHWYESPQGSECSGWQDHDWDSYQVAHHRDCVDMGDENPIRLLQTETKNFNYKGE